MATRNNNHPSKVWFYFAAVLSLVIVLLNFYYALHATPHLSQRLHHENCVQPSTHDSVYNNWNNNNIHDTVPFDSTPLVAHLKQKQIPKRTVVVFTCNKAYGRAVASSVISVRIDGGYDGDVAILMEESQNFTISWMQHEIQHEHEIQQQQRQQQHNQKESRKYATVSNENGNRNHDNPLHRVFIFSTDELWDSLVSWSSSSSTTPTTTTTTTKQPEVNLSSSSSVSIAHLRNTPPAGWCMPPKRMSGHRGYFLKTLIYHPIMAERWDTVLCESNVTCQSVVMRHPIQFNSSQIDRGIYDDIGSPLTYSIVLLFVFACFSWWLILFSFSLNVSPYPTNSFCWGMGPLSIFADTTNIYI
jgi:hypothetical protein